MKLIFMKTIFLLILFVLLASCSKTVESKETIKSTERVEKISYVRNLSDDGTNLYKASIDSIVAKDALGRIIGENSGFKENKQVGMFYFAWIGVYVKLKTVQKRG